MAVLEVRDLCTSFFVAQGELRALESVSFDVDSGETLAIVGESGCGKSLTALSIMRLVPDPPGRIVGGSVTLEGRDLLKLRRDEMEAVRGDRIAMIFQEPMTSLNPVMTIGDQIVETLLAHRPMTGAAARRRALDLLEMVRISEPGRRLDDYPHRLSGGMRQRVMIAIALALEPKILIADEPTTALDVTIQAQILDLLRSMQKQLGIGIMLITHDLGVVAQMADRVMVMYAGRKIEEGSVSALLRNPSHPYTRGLLGSMPRSGAPRHRLQEIPGMVPALGSRPDGCAFAPRCAEAMASCVTMPQLKSVGLLHRVSCHARTGGPASVEVGAAT